MSNASHLSPYEQLQLLNYELIQNANHITEPVITVGGQAVSYWVDFYRNYYPELPDQTLIASIDIDFAAKKNDIQAIADAFGVAPEFNKEGNPPSLAMFSLVDERTGKPKTTPDGLVFSNQDMAVVHANIVDIIDRPAGFSSDDFKGDKLLFNTEPFFTPAFSAQTPTSDERVRILTPLACMHSRFSNLAGKVKRNEAQEVARIKALMVPAYLFLIEKFESTDFRSARQYLQKFVDIGKDSQFIRIQTKNNINLSQVLERLCGHFKENFNDYDVPAAFVEKDLPAQIADLNRYYTRIKSLTDEQQSKADDKGLKDQLSAVVNDLDAYDVISPFKDTSMGSEQCSKLRESITEKLQLLASSYPGHPEVQKLVEKSGTTFGNVIPDCAADSPAQPNQKSTAPRNN